VETPTWCICLIALAIKIAVLWDGIPCGSCENRRFGGIYRLHHQGDNNR
jgi:hypothetical protein